MEFTIRPMSTQVSCVSCLCFALLPPTRSKTVLVNVLLYTRGCLKPGVHPASRLASGPRPSPRRRADTTLTHLAGVAGNFGGFGVAAGQAAFRAPVSLHVQNSSSSRKYGSHAPVIDPALKCYVRTQKKKLNKSTYHAGTSLWNGGGRYLCYIAVSGK